MITKLTKLMLVALAVAGLGVFGVLTVSANAQGMPTSQGMGGGRMMGYGSASSTHHFGPGPVQIPGVMGDVTAIQGTTLTITGDNRENSSTVYSVDASNATVLKDRATSTVSAIAVGDMVMVQGKVTGDSVAAARIIDGMVMPGGMHMSSGTHLFDGSGTRPFASGTFSGYHDGFPSSTASSTGNPPIPHPGFFGGMMNFFGGIFGHFRF